MYFLLQIALIIYSFSMIFLVWQFTKRDYFRPSYAILWLVTAILFAVLTVFPKPLIVLADFLQLPDVTTLLVALGLSFTVALLTHHTILLSGWTRKSKELAQEIAIMKWQIEKLEEARSQNGSIKDTSKEPTEVDELVA